MQDFPFRTHGSRIIPGYTPWEKTTGENARTWLTLRCQSGAKEAGLRVVCQFQKASLSNPSPTLNQSHSGLQGGSILPERVPTLGILKSASYRGTRIVSSTNSFRYTTSGPLVRNIPLHSTFPFPLTLPDDALICITQHPISGLHSHRDL